MLLTKVVKMHRRDATRKSSNWAVSVMNFLQGKKEVKIRQIGDPVLRELAKPVEQAAFVTPEFKYIVDELVSMMRKSNGAGICAPQIGISLQIIAFEVTGHDIKLAMDKYGSKGISKMQMTLCPLTVLVNPKMKILDSRTTILRESCLSIENYSALVPRHQEIKVEGLNPDGQHVDLHASGWTARIIQHEMDHLQGNLYVDTMTYKSLRNEKWQTYKT
ncbi:peptide deformylase, mitochondrial-like [Clytia hemisphaerica]|uniref:peptide deformylase, mitochondrial-like n=1 Tax=Clytia hemisphaerica TaxID=252671 RepID=UPI0034D407A5